MKTLIDFLFVDCFNLAKYFTDFKTLYTCSLFEKFVLCSFEVKPTPYSENMEGRI